MNIEDHMKTYINYICNSQHRYLFVGLSLIMIIFICRYINYIIKFISEYMIYDILPLYFIYQYNSKIIYHCIITYILKALYSTIYFLSYLPFMNYYVAHIYILLVVITVCIHKYLYNIQINE